MVQGITIAKHRQSIHRQAEISSFTNDDDILETDDYPMLDPCYPSLDDIWSDEIQPTQLVIVTALAPSIQRRSRSPERKVIVW
jgi:hypothetical protein